MDGRISTAASLTLADQLPLLVIIKRGWSGFPVRRAIWESLALALALVSEENVYGGTDLRKSDDFSSEWITEKVREDISGYSEDGEDDELSYVW